MAESWVKVAAAPDESVALLMDGVLTPARLPEKGLEQSFEGGFGQHKKGDIGKKCLLDGP
jgi:hypothetical protein